MAVVGESSVSEGKSPEFGSFESSVLRNLADSNSVRTTIPQVIAALLGAAPGSVMVWTFDPESRSATVRVRSERTAKKSSKRA
jgi:hypothetical protein